MPNTEGENDCKSIENIAFDKQQVLIDPYRNTMWRSKNQRTYKDFFDVTIACEDEQMQAHKVILSVCSPFFRYTDLQAVLNFMYHGEFPDSDEICKECHNSCINKLNHLLAAIIDTSGILTVPPDDPPTITEVTAHFSPEDILSLNCSTFNSPVSPHMRWILNHQEVTKWAMELNLFSSSNLPLSSISAQLEQGHLIQVRHFLIWNNANESLFLCFSSTTFLYGPGLYWAPNTGLWAPTTAIGAAQAPCSGTKIMNLRQILIIFHFVVPWLYKKIHQTSSPDACEISDTIYVIIVKIFSSVQFNFRFKRQKIRNTI